MPRGVEVDEVERREMRLSAPAGHKKFDHLREKIPAQGIEDEPLKQSEAQLLVANNGPLELNPVQDKVRITQPGSRGPSPVGVIALLITAISLALLAIKNFNNARELRAVLYILAKTHCHHTGNGSFSTVNECTNALVTLALATEK